jgi:acyl dehydratase
VDGGGIMLRSDMQKHKFQDLHVGDTAAIEVEITESIIEDFCRLSGDYSEIHISREFAREQGFQDRLVHGILIGAFMSRLIGMELPGKYGILQSIDIKFRNPCYPGDKLVIKGEITRIADVVKVIIVNIRILKADGTLVATGKAQVGVTR